ncbi:hypothetical protein SUDANB95_02923 [Actinosynnema sp. ALI-1.44]
MWSDRRADLVEQVRGTVLDWVAAKSGDSFEELNTTGTTSDGARRLKVDFRRSNEPGSPVTAALRLSFVESQPDGNQWITRVRSWSGPCTADDPGQLGSWIWVDVDAVTHDSLDGVVVAAPRFVRALLDSGDHPSRNGVPLSCTALVFEGHDGAEALAEMVTDMGRDVPVVVFAPLPPGFTFTGLAPSVSPARQFEQAVHIAARTVAGIAAMCRLDQVGAEAFGEILGADYGVRDGAYRIYLPGADPAISDGWRHRYTLPVRFLRRPATAGDLISRAISFRAGARRAPASYEAAAAFLDSVRERDAAEFDELLADADNRNDELTAQLADKDQRYQDVLEERQALEVELTQARVELNTARRKLALVESELWRDHGAEMANLTASRLPDKVESPSDAALEAQIRLADHLCFPDSACVDLHLIDSAVESKAWGQTSWRAFLALHAYGEALANGANPGSFWTWCTNSKHPFAWPATPKKLAMAESETVKNSDKLWAKRLFPVDATVDPSGEVHMEMHIKIAEGGGMLAPRIYFLPVPNTGKVHIGYFGPHKNVPNTGA